MFSLILNVGLNGVIYHLSFMIFVHELLHVITEIKLIHV